MGACGFFQPAAPYSLFHLKCDLTMKCASEVLISHNLCPTIYTNAFKNNFYNKNPGMCLTMRAAKEVPTGYKMGYDDAKT